MQTLRNSTIVIVDAFFCTTCVDNQCLHVKSAKLANDDNLFQQIGGEINDGKRCYFLTEKLVIFIDSTFHSFYYKVS